MSNPARANISLADFTTCLASTEYELAPETDAVQSVTIYGNQAMTHNGDETVIISKAAGMRQVREMRSTAKACGIELRVTEWAAGDYCTQDNCQESN